MNKPNPDLKVVKPSFSARFKSKNAPTISGVETLASALPIYKIGDVGDWTKLHPSEDEYWTDEMCFVDVPILGTKRDLLHAIDDDLAVKHLHAKKIKRHRLALACKPNNVFFWCVVPSQNLDNTWNADALKACHLGQTRWVQACSRRAENKEGYVTKFAVDEDAFVATSWPTLTMDELLEITFKESNIDHDRHPSLLRLIGAKQVLT